MMTLTAQSKLYTVLWRETMVIYEDWARRRGLSYCELLVALSLAESGGACGQKEICREWQLPKQTVHTICKDFLNRGWVALLPSKKDKRSKEIHLTDAGKAQIGAIADALMHCEETVFRMLGEKQVDTLLQGTRNYNQCLREAVFCEDT